MYFGVLSTSQNSQPQQATCTLIAYSSAIQLITHNCTIVNKAQRWAAWCPHLSATLTYANTHPHTHVHALTHPPAHKTHTSTQTHTHTLHTQGLEQSSLGGTFLVFDVTNKRWLLLANIELDVGTLCKKGGKKMLWLSPAVTGLAQCVRGRSKW
jgi:hypothetical protein